VGDCYVAATGLPEVRSDHAVVMARFARDCVKEFGFLVKEMEETLGPDTSDLGLRVGLNSGPVTAGVLRYVSCYLERNSVFAGHFSLAHRFALYRYYHSFIVARTRVSNCSGIR
jgi:hypothetical protein